MNCNYRTIDGHSDRCTCYFTLEIIAWGAGDECSDESCIYQGRGNDVNMAEKPDIIVSIDLGTTYTGKNTAATTM